MSVLLGSLAKQAVITFYKKKIKLIIINREYIH